MVGIQTAIGLGCKIQVFKMGYHDLLLFVFFWLRLRRLCLSVLELRWIAAAHTLDIAIITSGIYSRVWLLQHFVWFKKIEWKEGSGLRLEMPLTSRTLCQVGSQNVYVQSHATCAHLVNELQSTLKKQKLLCLSTPVGNRVAIELWRLGTNMECQTVSHLLGVGISSVCVIVHQVCKAVPASLGPRYIRMPQGESLQVVPQCA